MKTLYSREHLDEIVARLEKLTPDHRPVWGKMNPAQMVSHCSATMEVARGQKQIKRLFIGYMLGGMMKKGFYNEKPVPKGSPTHQSFVRTGEHDLEKERQALIEHLKAFQSGGEANCTKNPHAFFGKLTPEQWGIGMYKHTDHHLQQFGL